MGCDATHWHRTRGTRAVVVGTAALWPSTKHNQMYVLNKSTKLRTAALTKLQLPTVHLPTTVRACFLPCSSPGHLFFFSPDSVLN